MAKKNGIKIPKRIAGVKIPKSIRKGPIGGFLQSSGGQLIVAEALLALGALYTRRHDDPDSRSGRASRHPLDSLRSALGQDGYHARSARDRMGRAFEAAIRAFRAELSEGRYETSSPQEVLDAESGDGDVSAAAASTKKKSSARAEALKDSQSGPH